MRSMISAIVARWQGVAAVVWMCALAACADPQAGANSSFVTLAAQLQKAIAITDPVQQYDALTAADQALAKLLADYPGADAAVRVAAGDKIGPLTALELKDRLAELSKSPALCARLPTHDCVLATGMTAIESAGWPATQAALVGAYALLLADGLPFPAPAGSPQLSDGDQQLPLTDYLLEAAAIDASLAKRGLATLPPMIGSKPFAPAEATLQLIVGAIARFKSEPSDGDIARLIQLRDLLSASDAAAAHAIEEALLGAAAGKFETVYKGLGAAAVLGAFERGIYVDVPSLDPAFCQQVAADLMAAKASTETWRRFIGCFQGASASNITDAVRQAWPDNPTDYGKARAMTTLAEAGQASDFATAWWLLMAMREVNDPALRAQMADELSAMKERAAPADAKRIALMGDAARILRDEGKGSAAAQAVKKAVLAGAIDAADNKVAVVPADFYGDLPGNDQVEMFLAWAKSYRQFAAHRASISQQAQAIMLGWRSADRSFKPSIAEIAQFWTAYAEMNSSADVSDVLWALYAQNASAADIDAVIGPSGAPAKSVNAMLAAGDWARAKALLPAIIAEGSSTQGFFVREMLRQRDKLPPDALEQVLELEPSLIVSYLKGAFGAQPAADVLAVAADRPALGRLSKIDQAYVLSVRSAQLCAERQVEPLTAAFASAGADDLPALAYCLARNLGAD